MKEEKKIYAVKRIKKNHRIEIYRELAALRRLENCANIITYYGQSIDHTFIYISYKYYAKTLNDLLSNPDRSWAKNTFYRITLGVHQCHSREVLHLDLKPANIMVNREDVRIIDFGLSRIGTRFVWTHPVVTIGYRAPELLKQQTYDNKVDIFSLGVILAQIYGYLLVSPNVHDDKLQYEFLKNILWNNQKKNFAVLFPNVPRAALSLLYKMFRENPRDRPSASEIIEHEWFKENEFSR